MLGSTPDVRGRCSLSRDAVDASPAAGSTRGAPKGAIEAMTFHHDAASPPCPERHRARFARWIGVIAAVVDRWSPVRDAIPVPTRPATPEASPSAPAGALRPAAGAGGPRLRRDRRAIPVRDLPDRSCRVRAGLGRRRTPGAVLRTFWSDGFDAGALVRSWIRPARSSSVTATRWRSPPPRGHAWPGTSSARARTRCTSSSRTRPRLPRCRPSRPPAPPGSCLRHPGPRFLPSVHGAHLRRGRGAGSARGRVRVGRVVHDPCGTRSRPGATALPGDPGRRRR